MEDKYIGRVFKIFDSSNRYWGDFKVEKETSYLDTPNIHGVLNASEDFNKIHPIFIKHEKEMGKEGNAEDVSVEDILDLAPYLIDIETNQKVDISGVIFISANFLVTCEINNKDDEKI